MRGPERRLRPGPRSGPSSSAPRRLRSTPEDSLDFPEHGPGAGDSGTVPYRRLPHELAVARPGQLAPPVARQLDLAVEPVFVEPVFEVLAGQRGIDEAGTGVVYMRRSIGRAAWRADGITIYTRGRHETLAVLAALEQLMGQGRRGFAIDPAWLRAEAPPHTFVTTLKGVSCAERNPDEHPGGTISDRLVPILEQMSEVSGMTAERWVCVALYALRDSGFDPHRPWLARR